MGVSTFVDVNGCARCDGVGHPLLEFREFRRPVVVASEGVRVGDAPAAAHEVKLDPLGALPDDRRADPARDGRPPCRGLLTDPGRTLVRMPTMVIWHVAGPVEDELMNGEVVPSVRCLACDVLVWTAFLDDSGVPPVLGVRVELPSSCPGSHSHDGL